MKQQQQAEQTYDLSLLEESALKWRQSKGLRIVYGSIYREIDKRLVHGDSLELGSGIGGIKSFLPDIVTSDIIKTPYVDLACSAYEIPQPQPHTEDRWSNIIAFDVLHHLCRPMDFFSSAANALQKGGRIILVEPAGTPFGRLFYGLFHPEPVAPWEINPPFVFDAASNSGEFANMAMGTSLFLSYYDTIDKLLKASGLRVSEITFRDIMAYPLSGGYSSPQMLPSSLIKGLLALERLLPQRVLRWISLRMLVVVEKV